MCNRMVRALTIAGFGDTQCGLTSSRGQNASRPSAEPKDDRFAYNVEVLALGAQGGCTIAEGPVRWIDLPKSKLDPRKDPREKLLHLAWTRLAFGNVEGCRA